MSFGMLIPNRNTQSNLQGGYSSGGTTTVNGNTYVSNLTVTTRIGNTPDTYKAANSIEFVGEYVDNGGEEYEAFIVNQTNPDPNPTTGTINSNNVDGYRYGFNGKENDNEVIGEGNFQDYGFRMYNSRLGRFISVDPLKDKFPMLSTYQFAGNMPIMYIDLDGLEPANNPKSPGTKEKVGMAVVSGVAGGAFAHNAIENPSTLNPFKEKETLQGKGLCKGNNNYTTDTKGDPTNQFNMYVSTGSTFKVDESNANKFNNYEAFVVNTLMQNMVSGTGAENYDFPTNGIISSKFLQSDILKSAVADFNSGNKVESKQYAFGAKELYNDTKRNGTLFNITGLTGSGMITIVPNKDGIQVKIFNITSLTSGTFGKEALDKSNWPKSYARDQEKTTTYGNISQTYNLFIPYKK